MPGSIVTVTSTTTYRANLTGWQPGAPNRFVVYNDFPQDVTAAFAWPAGNNDTVGL
jgi:hypothetical protein